DAEPQRCRKGDRGAGARDCRGENAGSQRQRYRNGNGHHPWVCPFHGPGSGGVRIMAKLTKKQKAQAEQVDRNKLYGLDEAIDVIKANATSKFDETVEIAMNLGVDPRHADQMVRGVIQLPNGTGKSVRVAVFARGDKAEEAKAAGAELVGAEDLMERIQNGEMNF